MNPRVSMNRMIAATVLALGGCGSVYVATESVRIALHAPAEPVEMAEFPALTSGTSGSVSHAPSSMRLSDLLAYARVHSPAIRVALAQFGVAASEGVEARELLHDNPVVRFTARDLSSREGENAGFELGLSQRFEIAGQHDLRLRVAEALRLTSESSLGEARWAVHVEVQRLFARILLVAERVEQAQRTVDFAEAMQAIALRKVELGESSPLVRLLADVEVAQARAMSIESLQAQRALILRLVALVGWQSSEPLQLEGTLPAVRLAASAQNLLALMAEHHPAVRTRELAVLARRAQLRSAQREVWPSPTVGVAYENEADDLGAERHQSWTVRMSMPFPLWSQNQVERARAEAELVLADREREETMMRLRVEVRDAASALNAAAERVELYRQAVVPQLEENLVRLERAYELGEVDAHQVFQTRTRLVDGVSGYIEARVAYYDAAAALQHVIGTEEWSTDGEPSGLSRDSGGER